MKWMRVLARLVLSLSCDPRKVVGAIAAWPGYLGDLRRYRMLQRERGEQRFPAVMGHLHPLLLDKFDSAGSMGVYFYQDLYVARLIFRRKPSRHLDIGSRLDGFVSHLLVFMDVQVVDVRPMEGVEGLVGITGDACDLNMISANSVESLSCLHALEHFGLGRYGDKVDPTAWEDALAEMQRVLAPGGALYVSVPVGRERVEFNAQRVFSVFTILDRLSELEFVSISFVDNAGVKDRVSKIGQLSAQADIGYEGCAGIFEFRKHVNDLSQL